MSAFFYKDKKILITGGLGFIGSNIALQLVKLGADVTILDAMVPDQGGNIFNIKAVSAKVNVLYGDIRDEKLVKPLLKDQQIIFNLAGSLNHVKSMTDPLFDLDINCHATLGFLELCRTYNPDVHIIYAGTRNQYGKAMALPVSEKHPMNPIDINGIHCLAGEQYHLLYTRHYGIKTCSLRIGNTYGPRHQMKHPYQGVLSWFIRQAMDGEVITLYGKGRQLRDCLYVDDVVDAFLKIAMSGEVWGGVYNVGGHPSSLMEFARAVVSAAGKGEIVSAPFPTNRKQIEVGDFVTDSEKIRSEVGWWPRIGIEKGIQKTIAFYEKNKEKYW